MINLENVSAAYSGETVFEGLNLHCGDGERIAVLGPSGCGKTSLLRLIAGLSCPKDGNVSTVGKVSAAFQEPRLLPWYTALENVALVSCGRERALSLLESMELDGEGEKLPCELSGGMQQRVSLARALAADFDILLLDEPFKGLDPELKTRIMQRIDGMLQDGRTLVLVTRDAAEAEALKCRTVTFADICA